VKRYSMVRYVLILAITFSLSSCSVLRMHKPDLSKKGIESNRIYLHYSTTRNGLQSSYSSNGCTKLVYYPEGRYVHLLQIFEDAEVIELPIEMIADLSEYLKYLVDYESDLQIEQGYTLPNGETTNVKRFEYKGAFITNFKMYSDSSVRHDVYIKDAVIDIGVFTSNGKCYTRFEVRDGADHSIVGYALIDIQNTREFYDALDHMLYLYNK